MKKGKQTKHLRTILSPFSAHQKEREFIAFYVFGRHVYWEWPNKHVVFNSFTLWMFILARNMGAVYITPNTKRIDKPHAHCIHISSRLRFNWRVLCVVYTSVCIVQFSLVEIWWAVEKYEQHSKIAFICSTRESAYTKRLISNIFSNLPECARARAHIHSLSITIEIFLYVF